jgi:mono/diheme cytochrome c family protein
MARPRLPLSTAFLAAALLLAGCGGSGGGSGTPAHAAGSGAKIFAEAGCGGCHALAAAGSTGTLGPNLDQLKPTKARVEQQVRAGGGGMPSFSGKLSSQQIASVASFVSGSSRRQTNVVPVGFKPNKTMLSDCSASDASCYLQAFGNLAYRKGPADALRLLQEKMATDPAIEAVCHPIAHTIGAGALLRYHGDVGKAFGAGNPTCGSGYYHGLLQWKLAGVGPSRVVAVARTVCSNAAIRASAYDYYQCVHGLGHGLMLYTRYDLPRALRLCHGLATNYDQVSCTGGVFMENQQSSYGITSKWLKKTDLLYPCDVVSRRDKLYCYLLVTSYILPHVGWDWKKTADWCRKSDPGFVAYCFQSYGRDASGSAREQPAKILPDCRKAGSGRKECIFGAVRDILNNDQHDLRARTLCASVSGGIRTYCAFGIGSMLGTYYATAAERKSACAKFSPPGSLSDCLDGATSVTSPK